MRITTQVEYGLRCLLFIARHQNGSAVTIKEICAEEKLPERYAEQLLLKLRRKKIIKSIRGPGGGYVLSCPPGAISLKKAVEALDGSTFEIICQRYEHKKDKCIRYGKPCRLRLVWELTRRKIDEALGEATLESLTLPRTTQGAGSNSPKRLTSTAFRKSWAHLRR